MIHYPIPQINLYSQYLENVPAVIQKIYKSLITDVNNFLGGSFSKMWGKCKYIYNLKTHNTKKKNT